MKNIFAKKIKSLREKYFAGQSLRSVALLLQEEYGSNFFTYLSKIENGAFPSISLLNKITKAYKLNDAEYKELVQLYMVEKLKEDIAPEAKKRGLDINQTPVLFRKTKKPKKNES